MPFSIILVLVEVTCAFFNMYSFSHDLKWNINGIRILFLGSIVIYIWFTDYIITKENMLIYLFAAMIINGLQLAYIKYKEKKDKQIRD